MNSFIDGVKTISAVKPRILSNMVESCVVNVIHPNAWMANQIYNLKFLTIN